MSLVAAFRRVAVTSPAQLMRWVWISRMQLCRAEAKALGLDWEEMMFETAHDELMKEIRRASRNAEPLWHENFQTVGNA